MPKARKKTSTTKKKRSLAALRGWETRRAREREEERLRKARAKARKSAAAKKNAAKAKRSAASKRGAYKRKLRLAVTAALRKLIAAAGHFDKTALPSREKWSRTTPEREDWHTLKEALYDASETPDEFFAYLDDIVDELDTDWNVVYEPA